MAMWWVSHIFHSEILFPLETSLLEEGGRDGLGSTSSGGSSHAIGRNCDVQTVMTNWGPVAKEQGSQPTGPHHKRGCQHLSYPSEDFYVQY